MLQQIYIARDRHEWCEHTSRTLGRWFVMLMRTDPFRDFDRLTQQLLGTSARPSAMLMDAWREGDHFVVEFDLPGVAADSVDLAAERTRGVFSRQLVLGDNLDLDNIQAGYRDGVLKLVIPVAERAKPRKITISHNGGDQAITTGNGHNREGAPDAGDRNTVDADTVNA